MSQLSLLPLDVSHAEALLRFELENRSFFKTLIDDREDSFYSATQIDVHIATAQQEWLNDYAYKFVIMLDDELVGRINLRFIKNYPVRQAEVGYRLAASATGKGIMTKALGLLKPYARDTLLMKKLIATVAVNNPASQILLLKNQFEFVAKEMNAHRINDKIWDGVLMECNLVNLAGY